MLLKYSQVHFFYEFWPSAFPTPHSFQNFHHLPPLVEMAFDFQNLRPGPTARPSPKALCSAVKCITIVGWKNQISLLLYMASLPLHTYRLRSPDWGVYQAQLHIAGVLHMHLASTFPEWLKFCIAPSPCIFRSRWAAPRSWMLADSLQLCPSPWGGGTYNCPIAERRCLWDNPSKVLLHWSVLAMI